MLEFQLTPNSISTIHIWLTALLGLSFLLTVVLLLQIFVARFVLSPKYYRFSKLLLAVLASFQIFAWQLYLYSDSHDKVALWCFALAIVGGALLWHLLTQSFSSHSFLVRKLPLAILLVSFLELAGFAHATKHFSQLARPADFSRMVTDIASPGELVEKTAISGTTDCGKTIQLFERQMSTDAFNDFIKLSRSTLPTISERAMLRAQPFAESNCHGWVFTQGQHILKGSDVELILNDNNYTEVTEPRYNDVAVYRSDEGAILHTGVVRGSLEGATIVESKWGIGALYMHVAEEQPYSENITYYRTDRPSHVILTVPSDRSPKATANVLLLADQTINDGVKRSFFNAHISRSQRK